MKPHMHSRWGDDGHVYQEPSDKDLTKAKKHHLYNVNVQDIDTTSSTTKVTTIEPMFLSLGALLVCSGCWRSGCSGCSSFLDITDRSYNHRQFRRFPAGSALPDLLSNMQFKLAFFHLPTPTYGFTAVPSFSDCRVVRARK